MKVRRGNTSSGGTAGRCGAGWSQYKEVAAMLKRRFDNIITYLKHRITNATSESINAKIQWVKYTARGFRNKQNFINAIYFHCGGLDLAPAATK
jgi:transposase